jgi:hypothetical protein
LFPVFKKKGDIKNSRNYRGITITPTYSKIIEKIIKEREKSKILLSQNPLQKGFPELENMSNNGFIMKNSSDI